MRFKPGPKARSRRLLRALVAIGLILNQLVLVTGLPLPAVASAGVKDRSKPFPCMDRPCGCMNADQCWHSCCCFTMREKLAWAEAHGVEPPEFVREAAAKEAAETPTAVHRHDAVHCIEEDQCGEAGGCCACCRHHAPKAEPSAAAPDSSEHGMKFVSTSTTAANSQLPIRRPRWTNWIAALGCQGHGALEFLLASPSLPAILPVFRCEPTPSIDRPSAAAASTPAVVCFSPPVPPPRLSATGI